MRNLKKILALVLALMMVVSVMVVASAASFNDYDDVDEIDSDYAEAVEVLTNMGVFRGFDGGFQPDTKVTRAEVATLVYRILTGDVTDKNVGQYKDYGYFTDVTEGNWFSGYVNYAANGKYVVGVGEDRYDPQGNVTGYQLLVIMLRAIGYGKNGEFEGTSEWTIRAATTAEQLGITDGLKTSLGSELTREEVAYILFNAIQVDKVQYIPAVGYPNAPGETTIGYDVFGLEEVTGVLTANEYADLYGSSPLAAGRTTLTTADGDRTLSISTEITDLGLSKVGYIAGKGAAKTVLALVDGNNTVWETGAKADISNASKFVNTTGLKKGGEQFVNFDSTLYDSVVTEIRISYVIDTDGDNDLTDETPVTIPSDTELAVRGSDYQNLKNIFTYADKETYGWVTVGTKNVSEKNDISNTMTWREFGNKYLWDDEDQIDITSNENGNWLKVIDNNGDGTADYVFKTVFTMAAITDISSKGVYTMTNGEKFDTEDKVNPVPVVSSSELAEDDIVVYAVIDGVCYAEVADVVTETIDAKGIDYKNHTITCDGTVYGQSAIEPTTLTDQNAFRNHFLYDTFAFDVTNATTGVSYDLYLDFFGYVRAYTENKETFGLGLLTDGYYWSDNKSEDARVDMVTASAAETEHVVSTANNTDWTNFVDAGGSFTGDKGTWGRLTPFVGDKTGGFWTNVAAYAVNGDTTALYEVGRYTDIFMNTQKNELVLDKTSALDDQKLIAVDGNRVDDVYATTSTVYYYVTYNPVAKDLEVESWVGYANAPKDLTLVSTEDHAYAVYTQTRTSGRDYYYADVVVIEATSAQREASFVYLANTKGASSGHNPASYWLTTIGLDETGTVDPEKYIETEKTGVVHGYFPWFYEIKANSTVIDVVNEDYAEWGIYASQVEVGRDVYGRDYVYLADGTSFPTDTTPVYAVTYNTSERNPWVAYDVVTSSAAKNDYLIYVTSGKTVLYALNVSKSTYIDADGVQYILGGLYASIWYDAHPVEVIDPDDYLLNAYVVNNADEKAEAVFNGEGKGTEKDPFQYVAQVQSDDTNRDLSVVALYNNQEITVTTDNATGTGRYDGSKDWPAAANNVWNFSIDGAYFQVTVNVVKTAEQMINEAQPGDTVKLPAGTYNNLVINKNLVIDGSNGVKLTGVVNLAGPGITNVTIQNCEIEVVGSTKEGCVVSNTTAAANAIVTISNNTFVVPEGKTAVCAIYIDAKADCRYAVTGNTFAGAFTEGAVDVDMSYGDSSVRVEDNDFSGVTSGAHLHVWNVKSSLVTDVIGANFVAKTY